MTIGLALQLLCAGASGLLLPFCFPVTNLFPLAWLALIPLHVAVESAAPKRGFWLGWLSGTIAFCGIMAWVVTAMHVYGKVPLLASYGVLLLFSLYLGVYIGFYGWGVARLAQAHPGWVWIAAPSWWVALELVRTYALTGIPWALLGYTQGSWLTTVQIAEFTGVYGVSWLIVLGNLGLLSLGRLVTASGRGRQKAHRWLPSAAACLAMLSAWLYGNAVLDRAPLRSDQAGVPASSSVTIGVVQANIDQAHKWDDAFRQETLARYIRLSQEAAHGADLLLWPEAATPFVYEMEPGYQRLIDSLVRKVDTPLFFGSPAVRRYPDGRPYLLNSGYLLSPVGKIVGRYDKQHLVPFGEYIPFHYSLLWFLDKLVEGIGDFEAGTTATVLPVPQRIPRPSELPGRPEPRNRGQFGVVICYEVIFPSLVRQFAAEGANFMTTITNDAWFGDSSAPYQHFGMVQFRAVENRRAFARAANTGISGFIDPYGRVLQATTIFTQAALTGTIPVREDRTFYTRFGDVFAYTCVIIAGLFLMMTRVGTRSSRR